jgi:ActR/RegA family two-component response regulator
MEPPPTAKPGDRRGSLDGQVIVLLEDDELVRRATERMLRRFGAEVVVGSSSAEALAALSARALVPTSVIADYWLSRQENGLAAVAALQSTIPAPLRGLVITGDVSEDVTRGVAEAGLRLLRKPVNVDDFIDALLSRE